MNSFYTSLIGLFFLIIWVHLLREILYEFITVDLDWLEFLIDNLNALSVNVNLKNRQASKFIALFIASCFSYNISNPILWYRLKDKFSLKQKTSLKTKIRASYIICLFDITKI